MPRFLAHGSYTVAGLQGVLKEGGSRRREATEQLIQSIGGRLESYYFGIGEQDFYVIYEVPDLVSAVATSLIVNSSGAVKVTTVALLTPEEIDQAVQKGGSYRPPGA